MELNQFFNYESSAALLLWSQGTAPFFNVSLKILEATVVEIPQSVLQASLVVNWKIQEFLAVHFPTSVLYILSILTTF